MSKLCIILQSRYPETVQELERYQKISNDDTITLGYCLKLNEEVTVDTQNASEFFSQNTYDVLAISIKFTEISLFSLDALTQQLLQKTYSSCHIVLNTHGSAGQNDLSDKIIKDLVIQLSNNQIKVTQISALQCNAMKIAPRRSTTQAMMEPIDGKSPNQISSMSILRDKLKHLRTAIPQCFQIVGFTTAYDPISDKDEVIKILQGEGKSLSVKTRLSYNAAEAPIDTAKIAANLALLRQTEDEWNRLDKKPRGDEEYLQWKQLRTQRDKAVTDLGNVIEMMYQNITNFLNKKAILYSENQPLLEALRQFQSKQESLSNFDSLSLDKRHRLYKNWKRNCKINATPAWYLIVENYSYFLLSQGTNRQLNVVEYVRTPNSFFIMKEVKENGKQSEHELSVVSSRYDSPKG